MIISLQEKHGNQWTLITKRVNETFETERGMQQVVHRFIQLEKESKQGGRKKRRVDFTQAEDDLIRASHADYLKKNGNTYGLWKALIPKLKALDPKLPGKTEKDLNYRWYSKLSKSSTAPSTATTSTATTSTAITSLDNQPATKVAVTKVTAKKVAAKKVAAKKVAATKVTASKVAATSKAATKVAPLSFDDSDGYSSPDLSDGYSSSEESDTELSVLPQVIGQFSEYEQQRQERIARNNARLDMLGLNSVPKEAKKKVEKKRKSLSVDIPRRELPVRNRKVTSYKEE
jgi:hypothetical protein